MRPRSLLLAFLVTLPACAGLPGWPSSGRHDARTFYETTAFAGAAFTAGGESLLTTSDASGVFNVVEISLDDGSTTARTHSTADACFLVDALPDEGFLYASDRGGNERTHLYAQGSDGPAVDLTPGDEVKASFAGWHRDRTSFYVRTNERDPRFFDLWRYHLGTPPGAPGEGEIAPGYRRVLVYQNPGGYDLSGVSRDGAWVALTRQNDNADSDVFLIATARPKADPVLVTPHEGRVEHGFAAFSPDGSRLFYSTDEGSEFARIWSHDIASGTRAPVFAADWDVTGYAFSDDGRWLTTSVNADARTIVRVFDAATGREIVLPKLVEGDVRSVTFEHGAERLACQVDSDTSPSNLYLVDLASGEPRRLTDALSPRIREEELVEASVVRYPAFDGLEIPALLYRPHQATPEAPVPALVWVHGGPGGQSRRGYNPTIQHLVHHGYAVLAVNNRGSSGYGKTFYHLDDRRHGEVDLADCVHGRRYLEGLPWIDGRRVGIIGGSYGGYMVCAALAFEPEAFDVGIDIFGVTNWIRTLESIPAWWADFRAALYAELGDPAVDRVSLEARSPLVHARNIRRPLLVVQGQNDPRVLEVESREIVEAVRANGVPVEYLLFEDEGHGFRNKQNRIAASEAYLAFLEDHLQAPEN
jgi:dipeptidyl aminopeptidase/acylaminoacyl peptidase